MSKLTYKDSGVNYDLLDKFKRMAQIAGQETDNNVEGVIFKQISDSRGESASVFSTNTYAMAFVQEGLGTKNLIADAMIGFNNKTFYDGIAQDTVAMILNDLVVVGAKPLTILAYWAVGSQNWFKNEEKMKDLIRGWKNACNSAGVIWGGGETPILSGIINPETIDLGGSAFGIIEPRERLTLGENLQPGDAIVLFQSSGIHANGITLARKLADELPEGYKTKISEKETYGEALLKPTIIYSKLIQDLFRKNIDIHYMANITGHGWRKLMRNKKDFTYRIKEVPQVPEVLQFIQNEGQMDNKEAYATFNMGAGFAVFVPQKDVITVLRVAEENKIKAINAGIVEMGEKQVIIEPKEITFEGSSLQVRI